MLTPYRFAESPPMSGRGDSGLNSYSSRLAHALADQGCDICIVGPRPSDVPPARWRDGSVRVHSVYERGAVRAMYDAVHELFALKNRVVHVQHELFAFGGLLSAFLLPIGLLSLKFRGLRVLTTIHGVMPLTNVTPDFVRANRIPGNAATARFMWRLLIRAVARSSTRVHVHEPFLRDLLVSQYHLEKIQITVIPHGIDPVGSRCDQAHARRKLGLPEAARVVLFFGYLAAYKGVEYLLAELEGMLARDRDLYVVIAGGVPSRLGQRLDPQTYINRLAEPDRVRVLGFVADEEVPTVFSAADVLLMPYRVAMASSGPLSLASGYTVPVLLSSAFASSFPNAPDFFELRPGALTEIVLRFFSDEQFREQCQRFTADLKAARAWPTVAEALIAVYKDLHVAKRRS